jgi:hypothetical protein
MAQMSRRYGVSITRKVAALAHMLFDSLQSLHGCRPVTARRSKPPPTCPHRALHHDTRHHRHSYYLRLARSVADRLPAAFDACCRSRAQRVLAVSVSIRKGNAR